MVVNIVFENELEIYVECIYVKESDSSLTVITRDLIHGKHEHNYPISNIVEWSVLGG